MKRPKTGDFQQKEKALLHESQQFDEYYSWLQEHMPDGFFEDLDPEQFVLITHYLMGFPLQDYFCQIHLKDRAFVLTLDCPEVDLKILKNFHLYGIKNYQTYASDTPPPFKGVTEKLRIAIIHFTAYDEEHKIENCNAVIPKDKQHKLFKHVHEVNPEITFEEFQNLVCSMDSRFLRSLTQERLIIALNMFFRARTRDHCQYEIRHIKDWKEKEGETPSLQIIFAWRNTPKHRFLYRLAKTIYRHKLKMVRVHAAYVDPYKTNSILIMSLGLHGIEGKAAWEEADLPDFLRELVTLKYFQDADDIEKIFVNPGLLSGNFGNLIRTMASFVHQTLVHADMNQYNLTNVQEGLCRHPELTVHICEAFALKFHPKKSNLEEYNKEREKLLSLVEHLDTGNEVNDLRRQNILKQAMHFVDYTLKTNYYRNNKSAYCFRLDPKYLNLVPYDRVEKFPELPYGIFFIEGMHFIGFHIRFKDLARGGLRTVIPQKFEQMVTERNYVFSECYNLAYTQQKKNKDIPEGGAKGVIFLEPYEQLVSEADIYLKELKNTNHTPEEIQGILSTFKKEQKIEYLYQTQRSYVHSLLTLVNCFDHGVLKAKDVIDYWKKPEYIYLGPDENMHNVMVEWIAAYSKHCGYKPGVAFISSKPTYGINHKQYGVTSLGVNVYMELMLKYLGINPKMTPFTVKISGGPDGDVAGNQILNLFRFFPNTAHLLAVTDVSGTIFDPQGLDLAIMADLFHQVKPIAFYPPEKLNDGGFLLDLQTRKKTTSFAAKTLCWRKEAGTLTEDWLSGSEMNHLFRHNLHQVKTDIFIPAGGRPRTLNEKNYTDFLDADGKPTARAIIEGANLYLTPTARRALEDLGVLIIKDSSANKGGVICSSMEILAGLTLTEEEFLQEKPLLMDQILTIIKEKAYNEGQLLLLTQNKTNGYLTQISDEISERINTYTYQLLDYLEKNAINLDAEQPLTKALLSFCPSLLATKYKDRLIENLPVGHKKAIIACYLASQLVYKKGISWSPTVIDVLPLIASDPNITSSSPLKAHEFEILT